MRPRLTLVRPTDLRHPFCRLSPIIIGGIAYFTLPVTEYPDVVPPTVVVSTTYPGASAQTVADTMATPIEQEVNWRRGHALLVLVRRPPAVA